MAASVRVLGTVQDGGVPHAGCGCGTCAAARRDPARRRLVASIAVVGATGRALVVDATPDLTRQLASLGAAIGCGGPCVDGILLTHAHVGHYLGLAFLGTEAMNARDLPVWCTDSMAAFLRGNRPWAHLVSRGQIVLERLVPEETFLFDGVRVTPFLSPHRAEDTDTIGLEVGGQARRLVYLPDADHMSPALVARIQRADVSLVDGTFYDATELPTRDVAAIPHPCVKETIRLLAGARGVVHLTHLNHTNPLLDPDPARRPVLPPGFSVLEENAVFPL